jgi:GDSL-like Lipase/Acylhydrolase
MATIPRPRPKFMVVGDSLAQGCRSLSVKADYCAQSWGARVAAAQKWEFITPDFPREVLYDLEKEIRLLDTLSLTLDKLTFSDAVSRIRANLRDWLDHPGGSQHLCFDNLGLTGATIFDLYSRTSANSAEYIRQATSGPGGPNAAIRLETLGDLHISLNARFTLNPAQGADFANFTSLDWVRQREPEILAVQIGHNHGLFSIGFSAEDKGITNGDPVHGGYFDQWQKLADGLAALPDTVQTILVTLLPKVGATGNLKPRGDERVNGYAPFYEPVLSTHTTVLLGSRLGEIDQEIRQVNQKIQDIVTNAAKATGSEKRLVFLDTWDLLDKLDYKNSLQKTRRIQVDSGVTIDNRYLDGQPQIALGALFKLKLIAGGFLSVDGMHPSGSGYAVFASEAMKLLGLQPNLADLLKTSFGQDTLLSKYPGELDALVRILAILRTLEHAGQFTHAPAGPLTDVSNLADILRVMKTTFNP